MTEQRRRWARPLGVALVLAGLLWTTSAGLAAGQYTPSWFDPGDPLPCQTGPGDCGPDGPEASLRDLWWWVGAGGLVVLAGVALTVRTLDAAPQGGPRRRLSAVAHALGAAGLSPLLLVVLALPAFFLLLVAGTSHVLVAVLLGGWLLESTALSVLDGAVGEVGTSPRGRACAALAVSALAVGVTAVDLLRDPGQLDWALLLRHMTTLAVAVWLARFLAVPGAGPARGRAVAVGATAVLAVGALVLTPAVQQRVTDREERVAVLPSPGPPPPPPPPVPLPVPAAPTTEPEQAPVADADAPCAQQDLAFRVAGFDGAMGARAASVVATNTGTTACWLEGVPVVVLLQGGRPLALQVGPGQTPEGSPAQVQRVALAPGGTAASLLTWRTYGGWADQEEPQSLTVALDPATSLVDAVLPAGSGPAPFDIADGGAWGIAPWAPPWD